MKQTTQGKNEKELKTDKSIEMSLLTSSAWLYHQPLASYKSHTFPVVSPFIPLCNFERDTTMQLDFGVLVVSFFCLVFFPSLRAVAGSWKLKLCLPCVGEECNSVPAEDCLYGTVRDHCGDSVCAKGPGQICGGPSRIFGECGDGMHCKCNRCVGCSSKTLDCDLNTSIC